MQIRTVVSGGVNLHTREWGDPAGTPLLLIHGWSQNHMCWMKQVAGDLENGFRVVALDLRGHGMSDAPREAEQYTSGDRWADDIAAVMDQLKLDRPILVGWSYGGFIICDYLRKHGQGRIGGINFVNAAVLLRQDVFGTHIGAGFFNHVPGAIDADVPTSIAAVRAFLHGCLAKPPTAEEFEIVLAFTMLVRPDVRGFLLQRQLDFAAELEKITVPTLVTQGRADIVILPKMAEYICAHTKNAQVSWYEGVGHAPFFEAPQRFNQELARFASAARGK